MYKTQVIINVNAMLPKLQTQIIQEVQRIIESHKQEVERAPVGCDAPYSVMYLALKRVAEQYKPKGIQNQIGG